MRTLTKYLSMLMVMLSMLVFVSQTKAQTTLFTEGWESAAIGTTPPAGWVVNQNGYGNWTSWVATGNYPAAAPFEGARFTDFNSFDAPSGYTNQLHRTVSVSTVGYTNITVDFAEYYQTTFSTGDGITVQWSTNGTTWTSAGTNWGNYATTNHWQVNTQALPVGAANQATLYIAFLFTSYYGYDVYLDICHIKGTQPPGTLTGTVRNCNTNNVIPNVGVTCGGVGPIMTNAAGVYTIPGVPTGTQTVTASNAAYQPFTGGPVTIVSNTTTTYNFCMLPLPGIISGIVTNAANGNPVVGAQITWGTYVTYSVIGGVYSLTTYATGPFALQASKEGFNNFSQPGVTATIPSPPNTVVNIAMSEDTPPPSNPFVASLNAGQTAVNLTWGLPVDDMVLIYDDGIQDNFAIWATSGNKNAEKFTPISYPCIIKGFYLNIGTAANYAPTWNAFSTIKIQLCADSSGLPGAPLAAAYTYTPSAYGWNKSAFPTNVTLASGNFFIVMTQTQPEATSPGIAIDTTLQQLRSFSKFGSTPWIPGPGNFMVRAIVNGSGGPLMMTDNSSPTITASAVPGLIYEYAPATVTGTQGSPKVYPEMGYNPDNLLGYQIWRLQQGQEGTPALWTSVGTPTATNITDNSYPSLPCGGYRWAAEAQYTFNRWSTAVFSTVVGKCWTCNVTINVAVSCDSTTAVGAQVHFVDQIVDTEYYYVMTASGTHTFTNFWKGTYNLTVNKFGYTVYTQTNIAIYGDLTINVMLLQIKAPPTHLVIHDTDAYATWWPPVTTQAFWTENFTGGFATNGWVPDANSHWYVNTIDGNPGSCAEWLWSPDVTSYSDALTSKTLTGVSSAILLLQYDIHLNSVGTTGLDQLAVEVFDGASWTQVHNYTNAASFAYTTSIDNITAHAPSTGFKVRFRSYGDDSQYINWWDIDNVKLVAQTDPHDPCIIGYNFYINGAIDGFTTDTFYFIPPSHLVYGTTYQACVNAVYGSGYSIFAADPNGGCRTFTSHFLCPPNSLTGTAIECSAYLTWQKPNCGGCALAQYKFDNGTMANATTINPGYNFQMGNLFPVTPATNSGVIKSFDMYFTQVVGNTTAQSTNVFIYNSAYTLIGTSPAFVNTAASYPSGTWINVACPDIPYTGSFYALVNYNAPSPLNYFAYENSTVTAGYPDGLAWTNYNGTFGDAVTVFADPVNYPPPMNFLMRANVCVSGGKDSKITTIDPGQVTPPSNKAIQVLPTNASMIAGANANVSVGDPIAPEAPEATTLTGFRVWRNNVQIGGVLPSTTLQYYDYNLTPGTYAYSVDAVYNVAPIPPITVYSRKDGPVHVSPVCGYPLPFYEPWDLATFSYQQWTFSPNQGNWIMNTAFGDPTPCADFQWDPVVTNYNQALVSPTINASAYTCANIYCDIDLKLVDRNATGTELLDVDVMVNGNWINKAEFADSGSYDWTLKHIDISSVQGKAFQVRFRANGPSSGNILHWYLDNIHMYAVCHPPTTLAGHQNQFTTTLTWVAPVCSKAGPTPQWIHWDSGSNSTSIGYNGVADFWIAARWTPTQLAPLDGGSVFKVQFWPASAGVATFRVRIWEGPMAATLVTDQAIASVTNDAWNIITLTTPHVIDISQEMWVGFDVNATSGWPAGCDAGPAIDNYGDWIHDPTTGWGTLVASSLNYNWNIQAWVAPSKKDAPVENVSIPQTALVPSTGLTLGASGIINTNPTPAGTGTGFIAPLAPAGSQFMGYNVYRTPDNATTPFTKINPSVLSALTYADAHPTTTEPPTTWKYYVTDVFQDSVNPGITLCESPSDTITIMFPAVGLNDLSNNSVSLYPNPANDVVNVVSTNDIKSIEALNYIGQVVYTNNNMNQTTFPMNVSSFKAGVYFVRVTTTTGITTTKITVTH
jgi:hypothetical protein